MGSFVSAGRIRFETLRTLAFGGIAAGFNPIGLPFSNPVRLLSVTNTTNQNLIFSFNGVDDQIILITQTAKIYDFGTNRSATGSVLEQSAGERIYVRAEGVLPVSGSVYVEVIYASDM